MIIDLEADNMAKARITKVMMDDTSINVSKEVDLVFSIANSLRGAYKSDKYKDVIIPMIIYVVSNVRSQKRRKPLLPPSSGSATRRRRYWKVSRVTNFITRGAIPLPNS